jgi:DNA-binding transcriptional regulator YiaG
MSDKNLNTPDSNNLIEGIEYAGQVLRSAREPEQGSVVAISDAEIPPTMTFRHKHGLSHADLAAILGVTEDDVVDWETDEAKPTAPVQLLLELLYVQPELVIETAKSLQNRAIANLTAAP